MASNRARDFRGMSFGEAPFIEPVSATTYPSSYADGEDAQVAPKPSADRSPSRITQNAIDSNSLELNLQGGVQRSSFNPSASIWVPAASTQRREREDNTRPLVVGYPPGYRAANSRQNQDQVQTQNHVQSQVQNQAQNQFDLVSFALAHTQGHDKDMNAGAP
ncbi:hypothetical protein V8C42DRAFT_267248 [Trichoderma barbatum]